MQRSPIRTSHQFSPTIISEGWIHLCVCNLKLQYFVQYLATNFSTVIAQGQPVRRLSQREAGARGTGSGQCAITAMDCEITDSGQPPRGVAQVVASFISANARDEVVSL